MLALVKESRANEWHRAIRGKFHGSGYHYSSFFSKFVQCMSLFMAHRVRDCRASECRLSGEEQKSLLDASNGASHPKQTSGPPTRS
jgi:hypothetical protein